MIKKIVNGITITGIDDKTDMKWLQNISKKYPWVEWGILISIKRTAVCRYPSISWIKKVLGLPLNFSIHICGKIMREICKGDWKSFLNLTLPFTFKRIQLNLSNEIKFKNFNKIDFLKGLNTIDLLSDKQIILQLKNINHPIIHYSNQIRDVTPLYDISGGRGKFTTKWPGVFPINKCGFAGGLTTENVNSALKSILVNVDNNLDYIWIDVESGVRDVNNNLSKLKVEKFLETAKPWIKND